VHDLELPAGAKSLVDGDDAVVTCTVAVEKGEDAALAGVEPELIGRKPTEEGEAETGKS
jgi:hypothetical protein